MLLFAITKHCCRSGKISLVEEQQQDVATGVSCQLPFLRKAVKSGLNYSRSAIVSAALKIGSPKLSCTHYLLCDNIQHGTTFLLARF